MLLRAIYRQFWGQPGKPTAKTDWGILRGSVAVAAIITIFFNQIIYELFDAIHSEQQ